MQVELKIFKDIIYEGSAPASLDEKGKVVDWEQPFYYLVDKYYYEITFDNKFLTDIREVRDYTNYNVTFNFDDDKKKIKILEKLNRKEFERAKKGRIKAEERIKIFPNSISLKEFPSSIEDYMNHSIEWFYKNNFIPPELDGEEIDIKELIKWGGTPNQLQEFYIQLKEKFLEPNCRCIDFASHFQINKKTVRSLYHKGKINFNGDQKELAYLFYNLNAAFNLDNRWEILSQNFLLHGVDIDSANLRKSFGKEPSYTPPKTKKTLDLIIRSVLSTN